MYSDGKGKVYWVSMKEWDESIWKYEEAFYQTILQNSDFKKFIPDYFGESDVPDKCNVW